MSKPTFTAAPTIPVGILVSNAAKPTKRERPVPAKRTSAPERPLPWLWIAISGSAVWVLIVAIVGVCNLAQDRSQPTPKTLALNPPLVAPVVLPAPLPVPDEQFEGDPAPVPGIVEPVILLRPNRLPLIEDVPLVIEIKPGPPPFGAPPAPPIKRPRKLVDTTVYANCEDVGSDVLFMKDPIEAFKRAKAEKKQVFMVHLSGNLEDPGCT